MAALYIIDRGIGEIETLRAELPAGAETLLATTVLGVIGYGTNQGVENG